MYAKQEVAIGQVAPNRSVADGLNAAVQRLDTLIEGLAALQERISGKNTPSTARDSAMPSIPLVQVPVSLHQGLDIATELLSQLRSQLV